jgi:hypothetical protein
VGEREAVGLELVDDVDARGRREREDRGERRLDGGGTLTCRPSGGTTSAASSS